jgi:hypothetical protein
MEAARDDAGEDDGAAPDDHALIARWTHDVRIRALARREHAPDDARRWRRAAWMVALALHVVLILALWRLSPLPAPSDEDQAIIVDLIESPPAFPREPEPPVRAPAPSPPARPRARAPATAPAATPPAASAAVEFAPLEYAPIGSAPIESAPLEPESEPRLFAPDGTALVPDDLASRIDRERREKQGFIAAEPKPSPLFARKRPLKVRPNHFAQYWDGTDGMPLHDRIWRYVTATHEFTAPWGGRWQCAYVLMIVACADVPDKPWIPPQTWKPATELDEE